MTIRSEAEVRVLRAEAERRARAGFSRPQISRALGVPLHALARWAFEGGWRAKDLMAETEETRLTALNERIEAQNAQELAQEELAKEELAREERCQEERAQQAAQKAEPQQVEHKGAWPPPDASAPWAERAARAPVPPWAPGDAFPAPEACALFLAEDLMRQGLLAEAERALRFCRNWMTVSRQVFDKQDRDDEEGRRLDEQLRADAAREAERETTRTRLADWVASGQIHRGQFHPGESESSSSNNNSTNPSVNDTESMVTAPG